MEWTPKRVLKLMKSSKQTLLSISEEMGLTSPLLRELKERKFSQHEEPLAKDLLLLTDIVCEMQYQLGLEGLKNSPALPRAKYSESMKRLAATLQSIRCGVIPK